ncbi:DNA polymerase IV [Candidatus Poribacteria bacterium]|nr:DNA polymerase IV [Candidatus Poribacteria bacterium]
MWHSSRAILHLDMDAYFASVEQVSNPFIRGKPVIITGVGERTIVVTASYNARKYGIKTGMTVYQAKRLCPGVIRVPDNLEKYVYTTLKIREILIGFTDRVKMYSIDKFFMDLTRKIKKYNTPEDMLKEIKLRIKRETKLKCSCGLAPNKLLAKLGSNMEKPDGLVIIYPEKVMDILKKLPVDKLHGIGKSTGIRLRQMGIAKASDLGNAPPDLLKSHFGFSGHILRLMGNGIDNSKVPCYWEHRKEKSIGHYHTLPFDTLDMDLIKACILMLCLRVTTRMRDKKRSAKTVALTVRYSDFTTFSRRKTVGYFMETMQGIYNICLKILESIGELTKPVRLLGVTLSGLAEGGRQLYLLDDLEKESRLNKAISEINDKFGDFTIKPASILIMSADKRFKNN